MAPRKPPPLPKSHHMGRVTLRLKSGVYCARYRNDDKRRFEFSTKCRTLEGAIKVARRINDDLELHGDWRPTRGDMTVAAAWAEFCKKWTGWSDGVWSNNTYYYNGLILPAIGNLPIASVRPVDLLAILEGAEKNREGGRVGPSCWNGWITALSTLFRWASNPARAYCPGNPARLLERRREPNYGDRIPPALSDDELERLLTDLRTVSISPVAYYLTLLAVDLGMRPCELKKLTWDDIDFDNNQIRVVESKTDTDRYVPMTTRVRGAITERWNHVGQLNGEHPPVPGANIIKALKSAAKRVGIPHITRYVLRHTAATRWGESGMELDVVKNAMGHKKVDMTLRYMKSREKRIHDQFASFDQQQAG